MTETNKNVIFFDENCGLCRNIQKRLDSTFTRRGFCWVPLQAGWVSIRFGWTDRELLEEMRVLTAEGTLYGGLDAWIYLSGKVWWLYPIFWLGKLRFMYPWMNRCYRAIAARRYSFSRTCKLEGD